MDGVTARPRISRARWAAVRLFAMDVDGILTDGTIGVSSGRGEIKFFSVLDGMGLKRLATAGVATAWISGRPSPATAARARELKIPHLIQGRTDKLAALRELARRLGVTPAHCVYMGDDDIDAPALRWAGIGATVPEAQAAALAAAGYVARRPGGRGAVRDICERILAARAPAAP